MKKTKIQNIIKPKNIHKTKKHSIWGVQIYTLPVKIRLI